MPVKKDNTSPLNAYYKYLRREKCSCHSCEDSVLARDFEEHCKEKHGLNPKLCCVWCRGAFRWDSGKKNRNSSHLKACSKMFISGSKSSLSGYYALLSRSPDPAPCPECRSAVSPKDFERHCRENHGLDPRLCCAWCFGKASWPPGDKARNFEHLNLCFRRFYAAAPVVEIEDLELGLFDQNPLCEPRVFFGKCDLRNVLPRSAFEQFEVLEDGERCRLFRDENLNAAASYLELFFENRKDFDWIHVMVRAAAFRSFCEAVSKDGGNTKLLPFSCWCDGGEEEDPLYRQHRHAIVVSRGKGRFRREVWSEVSVPRPGYKSKVLQTVDEPLHLANAMGYVSGRKSGCVFDAIKFEKMERRLSGGEKHFYVFETLPRDFLWALSVRWKGGLEEAMYQKKFQNASVRRVMKSSLVLKENGWHQKIGDFYDLERGRVLPVKRCYVPTREGTPDFCHLLDDRRLCFERLDEAPDEEEWLRRNAEGGNCFFDNVRDVFWKPRKKYQESLNLAMHYFRENLTLKERVRELENRVLRVECLENLKGRVEDLEREIRDLKEKFEDSEREKDEMKMKYEEEITRLKRENIKLVYHIHHHVNST